MGNISQTIFYFFAGELASIIFAFIIKDEKQRILVLIVGTILSGIFAFGLQWRVQQTPPVSASSPTFIVLTSNPTSPENPLLTEITETKDVEMVIVPAGKFTMGSNDSRSDQQPIHDVYVDDFYIDKYEVSNAHYKACVAAGACQPPWDRSSVTRASYYANSEYDNYPVIYVDWHRAKTYCEWRGAQLPTEAQWEKAARGTDGHTYPWGQDIDCNKANYCADDTSAVGSYEEGKSPYGVYDMVGNVWEWVADWYSETYYQISPPSNPLGPDSGDSRVLRGGAWSTDVNFLRASHRFKYGPGAVGQDFGFRCSRSIP